MELLGSLVFCSPRLFERLRGQALNAGTPACLARHGYPLFQPRGASPSIIHTPNFFHTTNIQDLEPKK